jgi:ankyrin repeat protein
MEVCMNLRAALALSLLGILPLSGCGSALTRAARSGSIERARDLLDKGANPDLYSSCPADPVEALPPAPVRNALQCALEANQDKMVEYLLSRGASPNAADPHNGVTPFFMAIGMKNLKAFQMMLDKGADVNRETKFGSTPLVSAAYAGSAEMVRALLARGADAEPASVYLEKRDSADARAGVNLIKRLRPQQQTPAAPVAGGLSQEELSTIVKAAVEGTVRAQAIAAEQAKAPASDIDQPGYKLPERSDDFAVVVGIGKYSDIPEAQFAERDAAAVKDHLIAAGFPSRNVIQLFGEKAGRSAMEKFLEIWLPRNVKEDGRVFFYFSGHGAPDPKTGEAYLIPWDGDPGFLENTGYPIKRLYEKLGSLKAKEVIVAMDACFSGAGGRSVLAKGARPLVTKVENVSVPQNLTVFAAASGDQITSTLEDQGHGTFTYYFLKGLSGGAKGSSGAVTARGLYDYLKPKVQDAARRQNRDQEPVLHAQSDRELVRF